MAITPINLSVTNVLSNSVRLTWSGMSYLLRFDGVNDRTTKDAPASVESATSFAVEIELATTTPAQSDKKVYRLGSRGSLTDILLGPQSDGTVRAFLRTNGSGFVIYSSVLAPNTRYVLRFEIDFVSGDGELFLDGVSQGIANGANTDGSSFGGVTRVIGAEGANGDGAAIFDLYYLKEYVDGTLISHFDPSASNGTGQVLPEVFANEDAPLVGFPTDDSQWVFYSPPAVTPINLSTTNLLATSVRLNWDQG